MFVSMNWIKDYVNLDGQDIEKLIKRFTLSTAEVEGIEYKGANTKDIVVGEIVECTNHPDSDHLHVLKVDAGDAVYDVVCGAPNARAGIKTVFCKPGGMVSGIEIKPTKLRGVVSNGMCCSEREIGISDNHQGIMELDGSYANGTDVKTIFPIDDVVFEVDNKSLTNRPDLWGIYGMAREFAALTDQELKPLPIMENDYTGDSKVPVEIQATDLVYRYTAVRIENVTKQVSPMEMQVRLYYCGTRAINLLADLTNYIMLEMGQPMHAFAGNQVEKIVVKTPQEPIKFTTLDGTERDITTETLMIYNNDTPVGIAGVMGGLDSEIKDGTNSVVLESANFDGVSIRKSASRMALRTDASARYEKTLDPEMTMVAVKRFIKLLKDVDPDCACVTQITDHYVNHYPTLTVDFDKKFVDRYTGIDISCEQIQKTLMQLGFEVTRMEDSFHVVVPSYRATKDVSMKADIIEEITRIYGYDNFAIKTALSPLSPAKMTDRRKEENLCKDMLVKTYGMHEVHTRLWNDGDALRDLGLTPEDNVRLLGFPDTSGILRNSMMACLIPAVAKNKNFKPSFGIFEIGRAINGVNPETDTAVEERRLGVCMFSKVKTEKTLYIEAVQLVNAMIELMKHKKPSYAKTEITHKWQHPKNTSAISVDGKVIGVINTLHPSVLSKIAKNAAVVCIEINMDDLLQVPASDLLFDEPSKFPAMEYDLSLVLPEGLRFDDLSASWTSLQIPELKKVSVVDIYDVGIIKSIAIRFEFVSTERTLTGEEVQTHMDHILKNMEAMNVKLKG